MNNSCRVFNITVEVDYDKDHSEDIQKVWDLYFEFADRLQKLKKESNIKGYAYSTPVEKE